MFALWTVPTDGAVRYSWALLLSMRALPRALRCRASARSQSTQSLRFLTLPTVPGEELRG